MNTLSATPMLPCPFCGASAEYDSQRWQSKRREQFTSATGHAVTCSICPAEVGLFESREDAVVAWNKRAPMGGQVGAHADQHPRWEPGDKSGRHPQTPAEWDYRADPVGGSLERSVRRLNVAGDYDDPRAPDQMALVLRIDVIRLMHDWIHKNAAWEAWRERRGSTEALRAVRRELWVDYCLGMGRTDCDPAPFNSRPHIRIIDEALAGVPQSSFPDAWQAFTFAYDRSMAEHSGTEPTKARQAGVQAIVDSWGATNAV